MAYTTAFNLTDHQMEQILEAIIERDKTYWLIPFLMGVWLDAALFGILLVLFVRWQVNASKSDEWWVKVIVVSPLSIAKLASPLLWTNADG
jgi:hypothetical protein